MKKTVLIKNLNFRPQYEKSEYENTYQQKELINVLKTGTTFKRLERTHLTYILLAGGLLHLVKCVVARYKSKGLKPYSYNRYVTFVIDQNELAKNLDNFKQVFDRYLSFYKLVKIDSPNVTYNFLPHVKNPNNFVVRLYYRHEFVRWGLIDNDLLTHHRADVVKKTNGTVKIKNTKKLYKKLGLITASS